MVSWEPESNQDFPNFETVGGRPREVMKILGIEDDSREYSEAEIRQKMKSTMSPREIRNDFLDLLQKHDIRMIYNQRIN